MDSNALRAASFQETPLSHKIPSETDGARLRSGSLTAAAIRSTPRSVRRCASARRPRVRQGQNGAYTVQSPLRFEQNCRTRSRARSMPASTAHLPRFTASRPKTSISKNRRWRSSARTSAATRTPLTARAMCNPRWYDFWTSAARLSRLRLLCVFERSVLSARIRC